MSGVDAPTLPDGFALVAGPKRSGNERAWKVTLPDGRPGLVAQLLPELARDPSLRRRYARDVERLHALAVPSVAEVVAFGPQPNPRDPASEPPWRARRDPPGRTLEEWVAEPRPPLEVAGVGALLAEALGALHARGLVLRDFHPRRAVLTPEPAIRLTDVGLARLDTLSSRTAASLILDGSPYASPEQLRRTTLDQRSDLYSLGVVMWQALTGALPFGDGASLSAPRRALPSLRELLPEAPGGLAWIVERCLAEEPHDRPESAAQLARFLRGDAGGLTVPAAAVSCQSCGAPVRPSQRLCLGCGCEAVVFPSDEDSYDERATVLLRALSEDAEEVERLRGALEAISGQRIAPAALIVQHGPKALYSKQEQQDQPRLPLSLFQDVPRPTAERIVRRLRELGFDVHVFDKRTDVWREGLAVAAGIAAGIATAHWGGHSVGLYTSAVVGAAVGFAVRYPLVGRLFQPRRPAWSMQLRLRDASAALPASDPLVRRLAALLSDGTPADVRALVGEVALLVQTLVDHRARMLDPAARRDVEVVTAPIEPLVDRVEGEVRQLGEIDRGLALLDEGLLVRALAASEFRPDGAARRREILESLDRLRDLEDRRASAFNRLLEAIALLRRAASLGLGVDDPERRYREDVEAALAMLESPAR
jgi:hypothetical protein